MPRLHEPSVLPARDHSEKSSARYDRIVHGAGRPAEQAVLREVARGRVFVGVA